MDPTAKHRATLLYEIRWQKEALKKIKGSVPITAEVSGSLPATLGGSVHTVVS